MNVFILNSGRCGSVTFIKACRHITNFTSGHETRCRMIGHGRLEYPDNHIEADNRLSWLLGRLDRAYGDNAVYVHLEREKEEVSRSVAKRWGNGIIRGYHQGIMMGSGSRPLDVARDYCDTVNANIRMFLKDKSRKMHFRLDNARDDFRRFWNLVDAKGDMVAAMAEFDIRYNAS